MKPHVIINLKGTSGNEAIRLAENLSKIDHGLFDKFKISLAVQPLDLKAVSKVSRFELFVQDIFSAPQYDINYFLDNYSPIAQLKGIILNHPEKKLSFETLNNLIRRVDKTGL